MFAPIASQQIPGIIVINIFLFLSATALLSVVARLLFLVIQRWMSSEPRPTPRAFIFFNSQLGYYAGCLLVANFVNCIAGMAGLPWLLEKGITEGSLCTIQATLMQFGNVSSGYFTAAIAVHTFNSLVLRRRQSGLTCFAYIAFGWLASAALAVAPQLALHPEDSELYGISGLSCAVKAQFPFLIFLFHLLPIFVASFVSSILYSLVYLALRGTLSIRGGVKLQLNPEKRYYQKGEDYQTFVAALARTMLWFPIAYIVLLVPYSVTRLLMSAQANVPFPVTVTAYCFWFLLGAVNVLILYQTFCVLAPAMDGKIYSSQKDVESSAATRNPRFSMIDPGLTMQEKVGQYEAAGSRSSFKPLTLGHQRTLSSTSQESYSSSKGLLAARYQTPTVPRPVSVRNSTRLSPLHTPQSFGEFRGLPAAPRQNYHPNAGPSNGSQFARPPMASVVPPQRNSSLGQTAEEMDIAGWLDYHTQHSHQGSHPMTFRLSAVSESIPPAPATASTTFSHGAPSPDARVPPVPVPIIDPAPLKRFPRGSRQQF